MRIDALPTPPAIFTVLQQLGKIEDAEMYRVFNMGIGFCVIVPARHEARALAILGAHGKACQEDRDGGGRRGRTRVDRAGGAGRPSGPGLCGGAPRPGLARTMARCTAPGVRARIAPCSNHAPARVSARRNARASGIGRRDERAGETLYSAPATFRARATSRAHTLCDARVTLQARGTLDSAPATFQARATRACGTLDSAPATFQARATSHLSHLIPLNPGESRLEISLCPSRRVLRPAPGGANAGAPRRDARLSRGRRCPPRASPRDRAGHGRAGRRSRPGQARPALRERASRRASP